MGTEPVGVTVVVTVVVADVAPEPGEQAAASRPMAAKACPLRMIRFTPSG